MARKSDPNRVFRERLAKELGQPGWNQSKLSAALKARGFVISQDAISRVLNNKRTPQVDEVAAIASVFGLTMDTMCGRTGGKTDSLDYALRDLLEVTRHAMARLTTSANQLEDARDAVDRFTFINREWIDKICDEGLAAIGTAMGKLDLLAFYSHIDEAVMKGTSVDEDPSPRKSRTAEELSIIENAGRAPEHRRAAILAALEEYK